jgi:DNA-binding PadR family transcriptional regulator
MKADAQALKGHLDVLLLAALEDGPRHGYAVKEALRAGSGGRFDLPTGTIYPALHRLESAGLIAGSWSAGDGRRRRTYRLTPAGQRRLQDDRGTWHEFSAAITAILDRTPWPATP